MLAMSIEHCVHKDVDFVQARLQRYGIVVVILQLWPTLLSFNTLSIIKFVMMVENV